MLKGRQWKMSNLYKMKNLSLPLIKLLIKEVEICNITTLIGNRYGCPTFKCYAS